MFKATIRSVCVGVAVAAAMLQSELGIAAVGKDAAEQLKETMSSFSVVHDRAAKAYREHRFEDALRDFDLAISINPTHPLAYYNRGNVRYAMRDLEGAIKDYTRALELSPGFALAHMNRGSVLSDSGRLDDALVDMSDAIRFGPLLPDAYYNRALLYLKRGETDQALGDYDRILELDRSDSISTSSRARLLRLLGDNLQSRNVRGLASELSHGREVEHLMSLIERSCLRNGANTAALRSLAATEKWQEISKEELKSIPQTARMIVAWGFQFLESIYYVLQSNSEEKAQFVCSVTMMPASEHWLNDFTKGIEDRFAATQLSEEIGPAARRERRIAFKSISPGLPDRILTLIHHGDVKILTLRSNIPKPANPY